VAIEAIKQLNGEYLAFETTAVSGKNVVVWAREVQDLGAGEIVLTSVDKEGTGTGYDIELTRMVSESVGIPVIAHGGPGKLQDLGKVIEEGKADAIAVASMIHYDFLSNEQSDMNARTEGNISFLKSGRTSFSQIEPSSIAAIKEYLRQRGIPCRPSEKKFALNG
jgi:cyclase